MSYLEEPPPNLVPYLAKISKDLPPRKRLIAAFCLAIEDRKSYTEDRKKIAIMPAGCLCDTTKEKR